MWVKYYWFISGQMNFDFSDVKHGVLLPDFLLMKSSNFGSLIACKMI